MIISPALGAQLGSSLVGVLGWAWSDDGIGAVQVSVDDNQTWVDADVETRQDFGWQLAEIQHNRYTSTGHRARPN